ncbi:MAG TPA: hypothetical protein VL362_01380 [Patescibacteria group bacterium]|nr:hypothetical protein [Patescibacteria group bacterium]
MARLPVPGDDADIWGDILNDFLAVSHLDDGRIRVSALPEPQVSDGSITPAKLDRSYVPTSQKGSSNGVATLDGTGKVPLSQIPGGAALQDATSSTKGILRLTGDLSGTADTPTVPGLASKYVKPAGGIPETDLDSAVQTKLNSGSVPDATSTVKGVLQLAGDLGGTSASPTVPGLATKIDTSAIGAANGVASLDGSGKVPVAQLPAMSSADATTTSKGILQLAGDLGGTADAPTVPGLSSKADDTTVVHKAGNETITGFKIFTSSPEVPDPETDLEVANKKYVDAAVAGARLPAYSFSGALEVTAGTHRFYNDSGQSWTINSVRASVGTPPTGSTVLVDINVDGTTIFTTQANRPTIADGGYTSGKITTMDIITVADGSYLTVDIDQIGTTTPGNDLTVQVEVY